MTIESMKDLDTLTKAAAASNGAAMSEVDMLTMALAESQSQVAELENALAISRATVWQTHKLLGELNEALAEMADRHKPDHGNMGSHPWLHHRRKRAG